MLVWTVLLLSSGVGAVRAWLTWKNSKKSVDLALAVVATVVIIASAWKATDDHRQRRQDLAENAQRDQRINVIASTVPRVRRLVSADDRRRLQAAVRKIPVPFAFRIAWNPNDPEADNYARQLLEALTLNGVSPGTFMFQGGMVPGDIAVPLVVTMRRSVVTDAQPLTASLKSLSADVVVREDPPAGASPIINPEVASPMTIWVNAT